jgi:serine/threonine protein kinase
LLHSQDRNSNKNGDKDESQTELMLETEIMSGTTSVESTVLMNNETELMADTTATSLLEQSYDKQKTRDFLQSGDILDSRYELLKVIGVGGQGTVYLARDTKLGTNCAVKAIKLNKNSSVNLLAEPEILKQIRHSSLPRISDIIRQQDYLYVVEEYFEGKSLQELINNKEFCSEANVIKWAKELAEILRYLHSIKPNPIIYRDMKPGNIIIDNEGSVRLIDFGVTANLNRPKADGIA